MTSRKWNGESSRPATLGSTLAAHLCLIVWCKACRHQVEPDVAEQVERYGAGLTLPDWAARLVLFQVRRPSSRFRRQRGATLSYRLRFLTIRRGGLILPILFAILRSKAGACVWVG